MRASRRFAVSATALLIGGAAPGWSTPASAKTKFIYSLPSGLEGARVYATDAAGNLYGTSPEGGVGYGTIFELVPPAAPGGPWTEQTLYTFPGRASSHPWGLSRDAAGNLYGATSGGMAKGRTGNGTVWELSPPAASGGAWTFNVLYAFSPPPAGKHGGADGARPCGVLARDSTGTLYGTTDYGGAFDHGAVFALAPPPPGGLGWRETVLHSFSHSFQGREPLPNCPLTLSDGGRVLYGTTFYGTGGGSAFRLRRQSSGWVYRQIGPAHLLYPDGALVVDRNGNLFGTSYYGGGAVFELSPPSAGQTAWTEQTLHSFDTPSGTQPDGGLAVARGVAALFGTAEFGGLKGGGVVFRLDPPASGSGPWTYTVLNNFGALSRSGSLGPYYPYGTLIFGHTHKLFGTTSEGGTNREGAVFSQTPDFPQTPQ